MAASRVVGGTVAAGIEVDDGPYADVDDAEEALVLLLELLLVKDLDCEHALFVDPPGLGISRVGGMCAHGVGWGA